MRNFIQNKIVLTIAIIFISIFGIAQKQERISQKSAMSINLSHLGFVRSNTDSGNTNNFQSSYNQSYRLESYEKDAIFTNRKPENEIIELRDRTSKHFYNPDGSIEAFISNGSINFLENDIWQTIEREIVPNTTGLHPEFEFANIKNSFQSFYSNSAISGIKTVVNNKEIVEWQNKKLEFYDADMNLISSLNSLGSQININHASASYSDIFPYTDVHISQLHDGRKIDYEIISSDFIEIIPEGTVFLVVSEEIILPDGWVAKYYIDEIDKSLKESKQRISIYNNENHEILQYNPPVYYEKENRQGRKDPIGEYKITQNGQSLTIKTITKADWFLDQSRVFPVIIDPTVSVYPNNTTNWSRSVASDGFNYTDLYFGNDAGYWVSGSVKFNISSIAVGSTISSVIGYINVISLLGTTYANSPWQFSNSADPTTTSGLTLFNSMTLGYSNIVNSRPGTGWKSSTFYNPDGNQLVANALSSGAVCLGLYTGGSYYNNEVVQVANHTSANRPYLTINYTLPASPPSCTTPISPVDGFGSHSPADPLTWNSAAGATSYDVYFGTSSNPPFVANVSVTSYSPSLAENTTYFWKIVPRNTSGAATGCSIWEFSTTTGPANGDYRSRYMDGLNKMWSDASNWQIYNGSSWATSVTVPNNSSANVLIRDNSKMIIDGDYEINELRIEGLLQFYWGDGATNNTAKTLTVNGDVVLVGNADFQTNAAYDANRNFVHLLVARGSIYNNANAGHGILFNDYPEISYWSFVQVRFKGSGDTEWSGTGENDLGGLSILKDNPEDLVEIIPSQLLGWGSNNLDGNGFFMYDVIDHVGTLKIGGTFPMTTRFGIQSTNDAVDNPRQFPTISSITSGNNFTLILDNPNFGISGYSAVECYGNLQITQGTFNVGDNMNDYIEFADGSSLIVDGGDLTCTGAITYQGSGSFTLSLSSGRIRAGYFGNGNSDLAGWFDIRNNASVNISGGEIHLINTEYTTSLSCAMYNMKASNVNITGGILKIGSSVSPTGTNTFSIAGPTPSIELYGNGSTIASNAIMWDNVQCYGYLDIPEYCGLSIYDQDHGDTPYTFSITGNINHLGNLYAEVENSKILFNGSTNQTFHTTGAYSDVSGEAGISIVEVDNVAGVQLTGLSTAVTKNFIKTNGTFHIGNCSLGLSGIVTRTNGYLGGNTNSDLYISGNGTLGNLFFDPVANNLRILEIDRQNTGIVNLATDLKIYQSVTFVNGILFTYLDSNVANGSQTIYLQTGATLDNESSNSFLYGKASVTEVLSSAADPGNLGANFTNLSENLGSVTIVRMTGDEGEQIIDNATSIDCYWDITVGTQPISPVLMSFKWLDNFDNGLSTSGLSVFSKYNLDPWDEIGTPTSVSGNPRYISAQADHYSRWTIAAKNQILPISLLYFDVKCVGSAKEFSWATAGESNSDYFQILHSQDNMNFIPIAKIDASGNSNQIIEYSHVLEESDNNKYYRLKQIDFDGKYEEFPTIFSDCNNDSDIDISIYPNPFNGEEVFINSNETLCNVSIEIFDAAGRIVYKSQLDRVQNNTQIKITNTLEPGAYILKLNSKINFNKQFVLIVK